MGSRHGHSRQRAARGWWATAAHLLALVLALSLVAPVAGYAEDLAYHGGGHGHVTELASLGAAPETGTTDPSLACHIHCGCHQVAPAVADFADPLFAAGSPSYVYLNEAASSIAPDRLPRPPRA
ncbi:hypothetical protein [Methylorubrum extorquens]|uniref:hypothetical protein n=1 Tax=Methylorubrum extorquens TaxID=408 RepID=UPI001EE57C41|nr:hypothetical protein [Methylorubrum extorquens]MCG5248721.1 hypothetical protein [Methylorubrum extorquens]